MLEVLFMVENGTTSQLTSCIAHLHMMHSQNAHTISNVRNTKKMRDEVLASVGRGFGLPRLGFIFNICSPRPRMGGP